MSHQDRRVGRGHAGRFVVLSGGEHIQARLLGVAGDRHGVLDPFVLARSATGGGIDRDVADGEDSDVHEGLFVLPATRSSGSTIDHIS